MERKKALQKKYIRNRILAAVLVMALGLSYCQPIAASAVKNAQNKKKQAEENLNDINREIDSIHSAQSSLQTEMQNYDNQLMSLLTDMELLKADMTTQETKIGQAQTDLDNAKTKEKTQYESMKLRIQYMYENGNQSMLDAIVESENITDFLNRVEYVSEVYEYDRQMLTEYQDTVQQVADLKEELEIGLQEMEELEISYQEQEASLNQIIARKSAELANFDSQLSQAQSLASQYAKTIQKQNQVIAAEIKRQEELAAAKKAAAEAAKKKNSNKKNPDKTNTADTPVTNPDSNEPADEGQTSGSSGADSDWSSDSDSGSGSSSGSGSNGLVDNSLNPPFSTGVSGSDVVSYATRFLGNPYVYGGNSLTNGADCSYFVMAVFQNFGISLPRSSYELQNSGKAVSYENAQPGDIICYPAHVAIYIGGGRIIHASSPTKGICYGTATYRTITTVRRVL